MKAITQDVYGSADVLRYAEVEKPTPGPGEVLIRVRAAGVDYGVWHLMTGLPLLARVIGFGYSRPKVPVRGSEVAGIVEAIGADVTGFHPGDEVFGAATTGSFAEYAVAPVKKLAHKPPGLTFEQAGALAVSGCTALQALAKLAEGQRVLIIGAAGGVGSFAVQLAKLRGAQVTGVCSTAKMDLVRSLGAEHVIDYTREAISGRYDFILDTGGNRTLAELRRCLTARGRLVLVGGEHGGRVFGGLGRSLRAPLLGMLTRQKLGGVLGLVRADDLRRLAELGVQPAIERSYPLCDTADAIRHLAAGKARGKLVITV